MKFAPHSLLWVLSALGVSWGTLSVTQPPNVSAMERGSANIICCWTEMFERVSVNWLKNRTRLESESSPSSRTECRASLRNERCKCSTLTLTYITREHAGTYICRVTVDIPVYQMFEGNGTVVTVTARELTGDGGDAGRRSRVIVPETKEHVKTTSGGRGIPETKENSDDAVYENTAGGRSKMMTLCVVKR